LRDAAVQLFDGNRLRFGVCDVGEEALVCLDELIAGERGVAPALHFDALAFEVLVDREEVRDLAQHVRIDLGDIVDVLVPGVSLADAEDLLIPQALVEHLEYADGAYLHHAAGEAGRIDKHQAVERVAVVAEGGGEEAVVAGVVDGRVEIAVETEDVQLLVVLVLVDSLVRNLDDGVDDLRALRSDRKL